MILPQFEFCDICSRKYKYVIKTRTMEEDVEYLMKMSDLNEDYYHSNPIFWGVGISSFFDTDV